MYVAAVPAAGALEAETEEEDAPLDPEEAEEEELRWEAPSRRFSSALFSSYSLAFASRYPCSLFLYPVTSVSRKASFFCSSAISAESATWG